MYLSFRSKRYINMTHVPTTTQHSPWGPSEAIIKPTLSYDEALIDYDALPSLALKKELPPKTPPPPLSI